MPEELITYTEGSYDSRFRSVNWSSIAMGLLTFLAIQFCFTLLGSAIGLSALDVGGEAPGTGSLVATGLYAFVTMLVSFYLAGYVSHRVGDFRNGHHSFLHGFGTWAIICTLSAVLLGNGLSSVVGGAASTARSVVSGAASNPSGVERNLRRQNARTTPSERSSLRQDAVNAAETARRSAAGASWWAFLSLMAGSAACIFGSLTAYRRRDRIEDRVTRIFDRDRRIA